MYDIRENSFVFRCLGNDGLLNKYSSYYVALKRLLDEGMAQIDGFGNISVPFDSIYELDDIERTFLNFPKEYPFMIFIYAAGIFTKGDFKYGISYRTFAAGEVLPKIRQHGPIITLQVKGREIDYLLSQKQFQFISALEEFNALPAVFKSEGNSLRCFAEIKELSKISASVLDKTLNSRDVILPEKIVLKFEKNNDDSLSIIPNFGTNCESQILKSFDDSSSVRDVYSATKIENGSIRKSVVALTPNVKNELEKVKKHRKVTNPDEIKALIAHPEEFFDPEVLNLDDLYSERVIGIGAYTPKIYPFLSPYKSQWIPAFVVEDRTNGSTKIFIKNVEDLTALSEVICQAEKSGENHCVYKGANIGLNDAKQMFETSRKQLEKKEIVTKSGENSIEGKSKNNKVLLIEDNMEKLGYKVDTDHLILPESLQLKSNPNLSAGFTLKRHQEEGVAWLQDLCLNSSGCLLADDMGLGKTLQVLYLLDWHARFHNDQNKPYLIVAPVSLLENWSLEYKRFFTDSMPISILDKMPTNKDDSFIKTHSCKHIMIVGYEAMRRAQISLGAIDFAIIVLDEAQKIKTPATMVTNAAKALKADFRIAMTGTPVENTFMDFWCIMDFSIPGLLGNARSFSQKYQAPLKKQDTDVAELGRDLRAKVGGYFLRRLKTELADELPKKNEQLHYVNMPQVQLERYIDVINLGTDARKNEEKPAPLQRIQELKKVCDHPYLGIKNVDEISVDELIASSAKLMATLQIVDDIKVKNEKVIVFTERREMQRMLQRIFYIKYKLEVSVINGETSTRSKGNNVSRQATVDRFQEKPGFNIIIMSQLAAGVGLNVTGANHVIHYSRHWNPAKEMQATDRVYRIGQEKDVYIHYPMAVTPQFDTFDVVLNNLLLHKTNLATASLYPTDQIEVTPAALDEKLFGGTISGTERKLELEDIHSMNEYLFEAFAAVYFEKNGFETAVTPRTGDKGVDVLAEKGCECYAIQCKHSKGNVGVEAVNEVVAGLKYYENVNKRAYKPVVFTNSALTNAAQELAKVNGVKVIACKSIESFMAKEIVYWPDIMIKDAERMG